MLVEAGILDQAGPIIIFAHDLIQQAVYENMPLDQRNMLHLDIGLFLGAAARTHQSTSLSRAMSQLQLNNDSFYAGRWIASSLAAIACDQINVAGPDATSNENQNLIFAEWNLYAGDTSVHQSNFRAALYYFSNGIKYLGEECWSVDLQLCSELHNGAIKSAFALSETDHVVHYARDVIDNAPFEDTLLAQQIMLRTLAISGEHEASISEGIGILRRLGFEFPLSPTRESIKSALVSTSIITSQLNAEQIIGLCDRDLDDSAYAIVKIMESISTSCYSMSSPFFPLITCAIVNYSLQNGVCKESACAFAFYGFLKLSLEGDYTAGKYWAGIVRAIVANQKTKNKSTSSSFQGIGQIILCIAIEIWFHSPRDISSSLLEYHDSAMKAGEIDCALISLDFAWRFELLGGANLSIILPSVQDRFQLIAEHSDHNKNKKSLKPYAILDNILLFNLTGKSSIPALCDATDLLAEAELTESDRLSYHVHVYSMMIAFWARDYHAAEKSSRIAMHYPHSKNSEFLVIYHTFFGGLAALQIYRQDGGEERLKEGREMMDKMRKFSQNSVSVFRNKWLLLKAEYLASFQRSDGADDIYKESIQAAQDYGNIHELGLAYELFGNHVAAGGGTSDSKQYYSNAYLCYKQWGASVVAGSLSQKHDVDIKMATGLRTGKRGIEL